MLVVGDRQCLCPVLLGFWVAQIGDGFGGDQCGSRRGHGKVVRGGDRGGFRWVLLWISMAIAASQSHPSPILVSGLWVDFVGLWCGSLVDFGLWIVDGVVMVLMVSFRW